MKKITLLCAILVITASCDDQNKDQGRKPISQKTTIKRNENPLLIKSKLEYGAPDFNLIKNEHFMPAILEGMRIQNESIKKIITCKEAPNFTNTILALEESSKTLKSVTNIFYGLTGFHTNESIKKDELTLAPKLSEHKDNMLLNSKLFERIKSVYINIDTLDLDNESKRLTQVVFEKFSKSGANLLDTQKKELKKINSTLASLANEFKDNLLNASNKGGLILTDDKALKGLSEAKINACKKNKKYVLPLVNTTQQPSLANLESREVRKILFNKSINRTNGGDFDTNSLVLEITKLRAKKAAILGFKNYASWSLQGTMAKKPEKVFKMFEELIPASLKKAKREIKEIQEAVVQEGDDFQVHACDWNFYANRVRKTKYSLDENEIKPYFELKKVLENGVFYAAKRLYGITFKQRTDIPTYHPDVLVYELFEEDGSKLGLFYGDYFARDSKRGGAWMSNFVDQSHYRNQKPVIYNICNFQKPATGEPALISFSNATTVFHEFGHALHGFFGNQKYASISGTNVARDYVEFPSQFNENWMTHPEVLNNFAKHYQTGEVIPKVLLAKIKKAGTFNQGYGIIENLASSNLDMQWHTINEKSEIDNVDSFEKKALKKMNLKIDEIPPRYRSSYFAHIFQGGYAAGYYSYLWTEMLSQDAYDWFEHNGSLSRKNGEKFRELILSKGNTMDYAKMYKSFTKRDPNSTPMLKSKGLM